MYISYHIFVCAYIYVCVCLYHARVFVMCISIYSAVYTRTYFNLLLGKRTETSFACWFVFASRLRCVFLSFTLVYVWFSSATNKNTLIVDNIIVVVVVVVVIVVFWALAECGACWSKRKQADIMIVVKSTKFDIKYSF